MSAILRGALRPRVVGHVFVLVVFALAAASMAHAEGTMVEAAARGSGDPTDLDHYIGAYVAMLGFHTVLQIYLVRLPRWLMAPMGALITVGAVGWYWFSLPVSMLAWSLLGNVLLGLFFQYAPRRSGSISSSEGGSFGGWGGDSGSWSGGGGSSAGGGASGSW